LKRIQRYADEASRWLQWQDARIMPLVVNAVHTRASGQTHRDADIYRSPPGLGVILGVRVLGEFGDDPNRYTSAKCRKNYPGPSPLTVAWGKKRALLSRHVRNRRLYDAIDQWAFCALTISLGARASYDARRTAGDLRHQALRALGTRLVGILHGCLRHRTHYNEDKAWAHRRALSTPRPLDTYEPGALRLPRLETCLLHEGVRIAASHARAHRRNLPCVNMFR
jgi:hypothetical protein